MSLTLRLQGGMVLLSESVKSKLLDGLAASLVVAHMGEHQLEEDKCERPLHLYTAFHETLLHRFLLMGSVRRWAGGAGGAFARGACMRQGRAGWHGCIQGSLGLTRACSRCPWTCTRHPMPLVTHPGHPVG